MRGVLLALCGGPVNTPLILSGIANGSTPGLSCVVETRQGQGTMELTLQANKRVTHAYTSCNACTLEDQTVAQDHSIFINSPLEVHLVKILKLLIACPMVKWVENGSGKPG